MNPDSYNEILRLAEAYRSQSIERGTFHVTASQGRRSGKSMMTLGDMAKLYGLDIFEKEDADHFEEQKDLFEI